MRDQSKDFLKDTGDSDENTRAEGDSAVIDKAIEYQELRSRRTTRKSE